MYTGGNRPMTSKKTGIDILMQPLEQCFELLNVLKEKPKLLNDYFFHKAALFFRPIAHVQNVLIWFNRPPRRYSSGDTVPLNKDTKMTSPKSLFGALWKQSLLFSRCAVPGPSSLYSSPQESSPSWNINVCQWSIECRFNLINKFLNLELKKTRISLGDLQIYIELHRTNSQQWRLYYSTIDDLHAMPFPDLLIFSSWINAGIYWRHNITNRTQY